MQGWIPEDFIEKLLNNTNIVDVIGESVKLKKSSNHNYSGLCPFHHEKTPSFSVSESKQVYYCFGCGAKGNVITFLMETQNKDFLECIEQLAASAGMEIPRSGKSRDENSGALYEILNEAMRFYQIQLKNSAESEKAIAYLKNRRITGETARDFALGYAPGENALLRAMGTSEEKCKLMERCGLLKKSEKNGQWFDYMRRRIVFPIRGRNGKVIGFGGRRINDTENPKYLNSPETTVFSKRRELYGLYELSRAAGKCSKLLLVEGYTDVLSLYQHGIQYAVATLGTSVTSQQLESAFRRSDEVVFCLDGDAAGQKAAERVLEECFRVMQDERKIYFLFLPQNEDPDTLINKKGAEYLEKLLTTKAVSLSNFLWEHLQKTTSLQTAEERADFVRKAGRYLAWLKPSVYRNLLLDELAQRGRIDRREVENTVDTLMPKLHRETPPTLSQKITPGTASKNAPAPEFQSSGAIRPHVYTPLQRLISLLLNYPVLINEIPEHLPLKEGQDREIFLTLTTYLRENPNISRGHLWGHWQGSDFGTNLEYYARLPIPFGKSDNNREKIKTEVKGIIAQYEKKERLRKERQDLKKRLNSI